MKHNLSHLRENLAVFRQEDKGDNHPWSRYNRHRANLLEVNISMIERMANLTADIKETRHAIKLSALKDYVVTMCKCGCVTLEGYAKCSKCRREAL